MKVILLYSSGINFVDHAIGLCYDKGCYIDPEKRDNRIKKVALKAKHSSVLEFATFIFNIEASTKVLLEMTRHRMASYGCKSSRYTLNKGEIIFESTGDKEVDTLLSIWKFQIETMIETGRSNDVISLMLPQSYQYRWDVQFNARSLKNFLELRRDRAAHFHIRDVANAMFECLPDEVKFIFEKGE
jgi:thymidylate synthase (FAD)